MLPLAGDVPRSFSVGLARACGPFLVLMHTALAFRGLAGVTLDLDVTVDDAADLEREVVADALRARGLALGAALESTLVLSEEGLVGGALRWPDEFVRHKAMDCVGDLALAGARVRARIVADRPANIRTLERYLLLANDLPGLRFSTTLKPSASAYTRSPLSTTLVPPPKGVTATRRAAHRSTPRRSCPFQPLLLPLSSIVRQKFIVPSPIGPQLRIMSANPSGVPCFSMASTIIWT